MILFFIKDKDEQKKVIAETTNKWCVKQIMVRACKQLNLKNDGEQECE